MDIVLKPKSITKFFAFIFLLLTLAHIAVKSTSFFVGDRHVVGLFDLISLFDLDKEKNIPTFCSAVALVFCSILLAIIALAKKKMEKDYFCWLGLAVIFLFLSIDEFAVIHERFVIPLQHALHTSGIFYFAWVIPYGLALIIFLLAYTRFIIHLAARTRFLFIIAGLIYITGALISELVSGRYYEVHGESSVTYFIMITIEECLEMTGIVTFIYALTSYIDLQLKDIQLRITSSSASSLSLNDSLPLMRQTLSLKSSMEPPTQASN
ncbi:MAG: hypothetical protein QY310_13315 [Candidatus Jettenia sp. CY-1]|nr:hypothetical protein [Candidatus Jettenia sp.]WKZ18391.1 MAG: hypothetical protein QY310_13315 [Candidatus Jettenia sp. CY-1]